MGGATATVEFETPEQVVEYVRQQEHQPEGWEFRGTPAEELKITQLLRQANHNVLAPELLKMLVQGTEDRTAAMVVLESFVLGAMLYYFKDNPRGASEVLDSMTMRV